jgi:hypothetical protein
LDADAHLTDEVRDAGDGQEVGGESEVLHRLHLVLERRMGVGEELRARVAVVDAGPATAPEFDQRVAAYPNGAGFGHPWCAEPEVTGGVEGAAVGELLGVPKEAFERTVLVGADVDHHPCDLPHGPVRFQVGLSVDLNLGELGQRGE